MKKEKVALGIEETEELSGEWEGVIQLLQEERRDGIPEKHDSKKEVLE